MTVEQCARAALGLLCTLLCASIVQAQRPELVVQTGHSAQVLSVAFSADGRFLAAGARENAITLWETQTGEQLRSFKGHTQSVSSVVFSSNGRLLASGSYDGTARIWDPASGRQRLVVRGHLLPIEAVALSPDAKLLASGGFDNTVRLWDAESGEPKAVLAGHTGAVSSLAFTRDGKHIFSGSHDRTVRLWEVATGKLVRSMPGHDAAILGLALSADGRRLASGGGGFSGRGMVIVWDAETGARRHSFTTRHEWISSVAFSPDGSTLIAGTSTPGSALQRWDLSAASPQASTLATAAPAVYGVAFSADGKWFAATGAGSDIALWDARNWKAPRNLAGHVRAVSALAVAPDGRRLASSGKSDIKLWDLANPTHVASLRGHDNDVTALAFSPQGDVLASSSYDATIRLWDPATGRVLRTLRGHAAPVRAVAFSRDGKLLASGSDDRTVRIWDAASGETLRTLSGHADMVRAVAFSPASDSLIASGSADTAIRLWDASSGRLLNVLEGHQHWVQSLSFRADGRVLASASVDRTVRLWEAQTGASVNRLDAHAAPVEAVVFIGDGRRLASGGRDHTIKVWDTEGGAMLQSLEAHTDAVTALATAGSAQKVLWSASLDSQIRLWSTDDARRRASLTALDATDWAVVDADGRFDASPQGMTFMHWVAGLEPIALDQLKSRFWAPRLLPRMLGFDDEPLKDVGTFADVRLFPAVRFVGGTDGTKATVRLTNRGGGLGRVEVFINSVRLIDDARPKTLDVNARQATVSINLTGAGYNRTRENEILVVVYNADGYLKSRGIALKHVPGPELATVYARKPQLYAIVAGISKYQAKELELRFPGRDAISVAKALEIAGEKLFGKGNVHIDLLADAAGGRPPTKANLVDAFRKARNAAPEDVLVVYLAGHGFAMDRPRGELYIYPTREAQFTSPRDLKDPQALLSSALTSDELREWLTGPKRIRAEKRVMVLDTCAAGAVQGIFEARGQSAAALRAVSEMQEATGFYILMGSARDKQAYGASRYGHGVLTYALLLGMKGPGLQQDLVDVHTLFGYAQREVPRFSRNIAGIQQPEIASRRANSFYIGLLDTQARSQIVLSAPKHYALKPRLLDPDARGDTLELGELVAKALEEESAREVPGDPAGPPFVYLPTDKLPGAVDIQGAYYVRGDKVEVQLALHIDRKKMAEVDEAGSRQQLDELVKRVAEKVISAIAKLPPPPDPT